VISLTHSHARMHVRAHTHILLLLLLLLLIGLKACREEIADYLVAVMKEVQLRGTGTACDHYSTALHRFINHIPFTLNKSLIVLTSKNKPLSKQICHLCYGAVVMRQKFNNLLRIPTCLEVPKKTVKPWQKQHVTSFPLIFPQILVCMFPAMLNPTTTLLLNPPYHIIHLYCLMKCWNP
jgi:hypothetical protein